MKAISLWQPWAQLCVIGSKGMETRSWYTDYRGPLFIHATKKEIDLRTLNLTETEMSFFHQELKGKNMYFGAIIGVVQLKTIHRVEDIFPKLSYKERTFGNYSTGRFAWELVEPQILKEPIHCRGYQKLWSIKSLLDMKQLDSLQQQTGIVLLPF